MVKKGATQVMLSGALLLAAGARVDAQTPGGCAELTRFQIPWSGMSITKAEAFAAAAPGQNPSAPRAAVPLPAFCRADGTIDQRTGADGKPYGIGFALALPDSW